MKTCNKCIETKPYSDFFKDKGIKDGHSTICKVCKTKSAMEWRAKNRERYNSSQRMQHKKNYLRNRLYRYKLTPEQYTQMLQEQGGLCKICLKAPQGKRPLVIDHCHDSGVVRGLLCYGCNRALHILDTPELHVKALTYLSTKKSA